MAETVENHDADGTYSDDHPHFGGDPVDGESHGKHGGGKDTVMRCRDNAIVSTKETGEVTYKKKKDTTPSASFVGTRVNKLSNFEGSVINGLEIHSNVHVDIRSRAKEESTDRTTF